ncbi:hypothetical protein VKT23_014056 [Stygiomarasmius scandens]|uniref:Prolyl 4-hydroxylase alpha subunit Fe(2+) 2OG dioxygenase domain-containing protein n=1 Tax=Marasmiellus scandens TaxID=2682957 RepID=A0ABR1J3Y5_9AGAR
MRVKLKGPRNPNEDNSRSHLAAPDFCYPTTLLDFVIDEGRHDHLDRPESPTVPPLSPLSSLTTTPQVSRSPSPIPSTSSLPSLSHVSDSDSDSKSLTTHGSALSKTQQRKKKRSKAQSKKNKKKKQVLKAQSDTPPDTTWHPKPPPSSSTRKHVVDAPQVGASFDFHDDSTPASTAYVGKREGQLYDSEGYWLHDLVGPGSLGFKEVDWDGRTATPITDKNGVVFAVLAGRPDHDQSWDQCIKEATKLVGKTRGKCSFTQEQRDHRRGRHAALTAGISYGGGQTHPSNLQHNQGNANALHTLANHWSFKRMSGFANGVFQTWAPKLHQYYSDHLQSLLNHDPSLKPIFLNSVFATATWNFGKQTVCLDHIDYGNLPFGWCSVYSLGSFDPDKGGHLVLWDLKLVIRFPPGSLIFIPSGVCRHSNTRIRKHERRFSWTQFSAGGLFRWVDHGFQTEEYYQASLRTTKQKEQMRVEKEQRWKMGVDLLQKLETQ